MMYDCGSVMDVIITEVPQWLLIYVNDYSDGARPLFVSVLYDRGSVMDVIITEVPQWLLVYVNDYGDGALVYSLFQ